VLLNTGHSGLESPAYSASLQRLGVRPVFLLHDLIPISHPEYCRAGELERHHRRIDTALKIGRGLILNSRQTLKELQDYADSKSLPLPPAIAAHLAPPTLPPAGVNPVGTPYFVILGTIEPRKNHWMLLQVWRGLIEKYGSRAPQLIVVGQRGWECENVVDLLERGEHLREHVIELPRCTDAQLATYLHHAQALLFPSFAEGYGLPLVEALSVGTPVIASNLPVFHEIAGDIPEYLDPLDGPGWRSLIDAYSVTDSSMREAQKLRMQHYAPPSWSRHFEQVDAFLEKLA
jgi:glycosyltransferase involved in cell wall biosynthesis